MEVQSTRAEVNGRSKVLRVVVGKIANARLPLDDELAVFDAILEPIETHINCLGTFLFDSSIEDAAGNLDGISLGRGRGIPRNSSLPIGTQEFLGKGRGQMPEKFL